MIVGHTLESIAKLAGVSRGTVSRVINNQPGVRAEVRERVLRIIAETGYHPNAQARSLAGGRTENIGVVVFGLSPLFLTHHIFYEVLQGIQSHHIMNEFDMLLFSNKSETDRDYWKKIADKRKVDGLIIMGEIIREEYLVYYASHNIPFVLVGKKTAGDLPLFCVTSNYRKGAYDATAHLLSQNRRRIVYIRGIINTYHEDERYAGYQQALAEAGIELDPNLVLYGNADKHQAYLEMQRLIRQGDPFDAVWAGNDLMAFGAIEALKENGFSVPSDVAVVGYDDIQAAQYYHPPLTTVRQDKIRLGYEAAGLLAELLQGKVDRNQSKDIVVENELIVRQSSVVAR